MKISIITCVFNSADTLEDTIKSVLSQSYKNIEYIIIDGGSTDRSLDIIKKYQGKISKIVSEKDDGIYNAMNKGIRLATGDIIGILNSDDIYNSNDVISKIAELFNNNDIDCVYGDLYYVSMHDTNKIIRYWKSSPYKEGAFRLGWHPPHPTLFIRKEIYNKYGLFNERFKVSSDFELMLRYFEKYKINNYYYPEILVRMRVGGESNKDIKKIFIGNYYVLRAFKKNAIKVNILIYPFYRLLPKMKQYLYRQV